MVSSPETPVDDRNNLFHPFRAYTFALSAAGQLGLVVQTSPGVGELVAKGNIITRAEIRTLADRLPFQLDAETVDDLAKALNLMRVTVAPREAISKDREAAMKRVVKAIDELRRELPAVIDDMRSIGSPKTDEVIEPLRNLLTGAECAHKLVQKGAANWGRRLGRQRHRPIWHDDAVYLALILQNVAAQAGKDVSFTKPTASAVEFVDQALSRAGVEHGSRDAIARQMARYNKMKKEWIAAAKRRTKGV